MENSPIVQFTVYSPELSRMVLIRLHIVLYLAGSTNQNNETTLLAITLKEHNNLILVQLPP